MVEGRLPSAATTEKMVEEVPPQSVSGFELVEFKESTDTTRC